MAEVASCTLPFQYAINFRSNWAQIGNSYFIHCLICLSPHFLKHCWWSDWKTISNSNWNQPGNSFILPLTTIETIQNSLFYKAVISYTLFCMLYWNYSILPIYPCPSLHSLRIDSDIETIFFKVLSFKKKEKKISYYLEMSEKIWLTINKCLCFMCTKLMRSAG